MSRWLWRVVHFHLYSGIDTREGVHVVRRPSARLCYTNVHHQAALWGTQVTVAPGPMNMHDVHSPAILIPPHVPDTQRARDSMLARRGAELAEIRSDTNNLSLRPPRLVDMWPCVT